MFVLKQFIKGVVLPPGIWLILLVAVLVFWRRKWARKLLLATVVVVVLLHSGLVAQALRYSLESRFPALIDCRSAAPYDAIVVLMSEAIAAKGPVRCPTLDLASFIESSLLLSQGGCCPEQLCGAP